MLGKVLIVDDSLTVRMSLRDAVSRAGFGATVCDSRAAMHEALAREAYSIVILDPMLRDGNGLQIVKDLRHGSAKTSAPVVILTAQTDLRRRVRALEVGADDFIDKPFNTGYLLQRVFDLTVGARPGASHAWSTEAGRILIVDDSVTYGNALADELRRDGHDVAIARTAGEALALLAVQSVACVVLDVFMPEVSGVQLCRRLRGDPGMRNTFILVATSRKDNTSTRESVLEAGADEFVLKTHDLSAIGQRVRDMLKEPRRLRRSGRHLLPRFAAGADAAAAGSLFERVVVASGMSELLGRSSLKRACERAGVDPGAMLPRDLGRALPFIHQTLGLFVPPDELRDRMQRIAALADRETAA